MLSLQEIKKEEEKKGYASTSNFNFPYPFESKRHHSPFEDLCSAVFSKRPILKEVINRCGEKNLIEYASKYSEVNLTSELRERQVEFIKTFKTYTAELLGDEVARLAASQLEEYPYVSTADHHGPLMHPYFLNSNLVNAFQSQQQNKNLPCVIALSCASVSLNNSTFPRGLIYNTNKEGVASIRKLSFLPSNMHASALYNFRAYNSAELNKVISFVNKDVREGLIDKEIGNKLITIVNEIYGSEQVLSSKSYSTQVTQTNYMLWKKYFPGSANGSNLIYIDQEGLVAKILLENHVTKFSSIHSLIFDPEWQSKFIEYFDGSEGGFSLRHSYGTYLFWGLDKETNQRFPLWLESGFLVNHQKSTRIAVVPEEIERALIEKSIMPGSLLIFITLAFYYGIKCLGGFCQVNYLTAMKHSYLKLLAEFGKYKDIEMCARVQTKELCEDLSVAFLSGKDKSFTLATGLDLLLYAKEGWQAVLSNLAGEFKVRESINMMMPEFYTVMYPAKDRSERLLAVGTNEIIEATGVSKKIVSISDI